jgi:PAS domain S-box-containing protein
MIEQRKHHDFELAAIAKSSAALEELSDGAARRRVLTYVMNRYLQETGADRRQIATISEATPAVPGMRAQEIVEEDLQGLARLTEDGEFEIVISEFWASSRLDAAVRLAKLAIYAHQRLTGRALSSRAGLTPLLKHWRLYDGNTRARLARERDIVRSGDSLSLHEQETRGALRSAIEMRSKTGSGNRSRLFRKAGVESSKPIVAEEIGQRQVVVFEHIENWGNFTNYCSIGIHVVDRNGIILWANKTELDLLGYLPEEYIGHFVGGFHIDPEPVADILARLGRFETVSNYPARLRARDGSIKYVSVNSNVFRQPGGEFGHSRCFTTEITPAIWRAMKQQA